MRHTFSSEKRGGEYRLLLPSLGLAKSISLAAKSDGCAEWRNKRRQFIDKLGRAYKHLEILLRLNDCPFYRKSLSAFPSLGNSLRIGCPFFNGDWLV